MSLLGKKTVPLFSDSMRYKNEIWNSARPSVTIFACFTKQNIFLHNNIKSWTALTLCGVALGVVIAGLHPAED